MTEQIDANLKLRAQRRVGLKLHIAIAVAGNVWMWLIYFLTWTGYPWPLWFMAASLLSIFIHWLAVFSGVFSSQKEYERLRRKSGK